MDLMSLKGTLTLKQIYNTSNTFYKQNNPELLKTKFEFQDAYVSFIKEKKFDLESNKWKDSDKVSVKFQCLVKDTSSKSGSFYPVTIVLTNIDKKENALVQWRTGSQNSLKKNKELASKIRSIDGKQIAFVMELEFILEQYGLLYGRNTTNGKPPVKKNPLLLPYFDKHAYKMVEQIIIPILSNDKSFELIMSNLKSE